MFGPFVFREPRSLGHILDIIQSRACTGLSRHDTGAKALSKGGSEKAQIRATPAKRGRETEDI